ncbi:hypothetical protein FNV43_RR10926 [Rhamnella rubrinervis]|uniref:Uncharacterized protein n=1 Tax=Rhamnella rubrinervis TaxID=2594499 RepID=A0A8K0H506_9ROSA|nr:hypothetical protein FNV43_RR10926 [Rhamnella rubrinervis]
MVMVMAGLGTPGYPAVCKVSSSIDPKLFVRRGVLRTSRYRLPTEHVNEKAPAAPSLAAVVSENARGMSAPQTNDGIGVPLRIAEATLNGNFGYFARILVDVDLAGFIPEKLLLETETHVSRPKLPPPLDTSQGQSSGLHAENPQQPPLSTRLNVSDTQVPTSVTVVTEIVAMDSDEEHSVPENIKGTGAQDMPSDLGDTFDDLNEELPPQGGARTLRL